MRKAKPPYQFGQQQQPDFAQTGPGGTFGADNSNGNFNGAASPALQPNRNAAGLGALGSAGLGDGMDPFAIPKIGQGLQALSKSLGGSQAVPGSPAPTLGSAQTGGLVGGGPSAAPSMLNAWNGPSAPTGSSEVPISGPYRQAPSTPFDPAAAAVDRARILDEMNQLSLKGVQPGGPDMQPAPKVSDTNFLPRTDTISAMPPLLNAPMQTRTVDGAPPPSLQLPGVQKPVSRVNPGGAPGLAGIRGLRMAQ